MKTIVTLLTLLIVNLCMAQYSVNGKVVDAEQHPVSAAVLSLLTFEEGTFVKAAITEDDGEFIFKNIPSGYYKLFITHLGSQDFTSERIAINNSDTTLNTITLSTEAQNLDEVTVIAEKPMVQVMADKTVFNVQTSISVAGDSGFEH